MFKNLIPWKKRNTHVSLHGDEPTRQENQAENQLAYVDQFEALFDHFFENSLAPLTSGWNKSQLGWNWDVGWEDKGEEYVFQTEIPGFELEDIDIRVQGNNLVIQAEHKEKQGDDHFSSYQYGQFSQTLPLPHGVATDHIDAEYRSGVLLIRLPKTEQAQGKRIEVKPGT